jgi:hypothetical protein
MIVTILLVLLILALLGGGTGYYGSGYAPFQSYGMGMGGILIVILIILLATGRL